MEGKEAPADGVITGWGDVDGRPCCIAAYDFTVMAGSMGMTGRAQGRPAARDGAAEADAADLAARLRRRADPGGRGLAVRRLGPPLPRGGDDVGSRSRWSRRCSGPCAAGTAYIPGLSDFVPMVVGQGAMALAGPHLTKAVTGEDISMEELGGAKVHCRKSGVGDLEVEDDAECIEAVKDYLSYFPSELRAEAAAARDRRSRRPDVGEAARHRPRVAAPALRHVRGDPRDRRRRRVSSTSSRSSRAR